MSISPLALAPPLCVDLDRTLLRIDMLEEAGAAATGALRLDAIAADPLAGRAALKRRLAAIAPGVTREARAFCPIEREFPRSGSVARAGLRALRPHQWVKNLLAFVPIFIAGAIGGIHSWAGGLGAFCAPSPAMRCALPMAPSSEPRWARSGWPPPLPPASCRWLPSTRWLRSPTRSG